MDTLARSVAKRGLVPVAGLANHAHYDHPLWHPRFGDVPYWASAATTSLAIEHRAELFLCTDPPHVLINHMHGSCPRIEAVGVDVLCPEILDLADPDCFETAVALHPIGTAGGADSRG